MIRISRKNNKRIFWVVFVIIGILFLLLLKVSFQNKVITTLFPSKVWGHRANSIEKFRESSQLFRGVELDVVFYPGKDCFDVNHPPDISNNLTLLNYFKSGNVQRDFGVWLDFKNLNEKNMIQSLRRLDSICKMLKIEKNTIIVESTKPEFLGIFSENGFRTSFYIKSEIPSMLDIDYQLELKRLRSIIKEHPTTYLSSDSNIYGVIKEEFPTKKKLVWFDRGPRNRLQFFVQKFMTLNDTNVAVVLVSF